MTTARATAAASFAAAKTHLALFQQLTPGTVSHQMHQNGMTNGDPVIRAMEASYAYAVAHKARFESPLAEDYVLGPAWLNMAKGARALLNGEGQFDGGTLEALFWKALEVAGFTEADL